MDRLLDPRILADRLSALPTFEPRTYLALNPDLALPEREAVLHFAAHGLREHRPYCTAQSVVSALGRLDPPHPVAELGTPDALGALIARFVGETVGLYVHSASDPRARLEAEILAGRLAAWGIDTRIRDESADPDSRPEHPLVFAPHEFFFGEGRGAQWLDPEILAGTILCPTLPLNLTLPLHALPPLFACRGVLDGNLQTGRICAASGIPFAERLALPADTADLAAGYESDPLAPGLPAGLAVPGAPAPGWDRRAIDLCLFGPSCTTRDEVLLRGAALFSEMACVIPYPETPRPAPRRRAIGPARIALEQQVARNARVLLAIDPEEIGSLSGYDMALLGFRNGALVVTRPLHPHPVFRPGEHFLEETTREIPHLIEWILRTPEGAAEARRISARARAALEETYSARGPLAALRLIDATRTATEACRAG